MVSEPKRRRQSGKTQAEEVVAEIAKDADLPASVDLPEDRERTFQTPGFSRMRMDWSGEDRAVIARAHDAVRGMVQKAFADAYEIMYSVYDIVREPERDAQGQVVTDQFGLPVWRKTPGGSHYVEDFTKLTRAQKEDLLFRITTHLFAWEQHSAAAWLEAMMAKAQWEEAFARAYDAPASGTIDDRRAVGTKNSTDQRYFAILLSAFSRRAEALTRSMTLLSQRVKDSMEW